jgi:diguanylate cyclase (GGDEF)-like protein/PAS domain S-box-containing protein
MSDPVQRPDQLRSFWQRSQRLVKRLMCLVALSVAGLFIGMAQAEDVPRHALEIEALTQPKQVLDKLPALILSAQQRADYQELALLQLAQANACRVVADWDCQRNAGHEIVAAAQKARMPLLEVRGLITGARARSALQDFASAEEQLARAENLLQKQPHADLLADVMLAYSSVSNALEKMEVSKQYAERGVALFVRAKGQALVAEDQPTLVRLLRNLGRAQAALNDRASARQTIAQAQALVIKLNDPKLAAELYLEAARLARLDRDLQAQVDNAAAVMKLAEQLNNAQLKAQAYEVEGLAALDGGDQVQAYDLLSRAFVATQALKSDRDAVRIFRVLMPIAMQQEMSDKKVRALMGEGVALQARVDAAEKNQAATNFEARLRYAAREFEVQQLQAESIAAKERERLLKQGRWLAYLVATLSLLVLAIGAWSYQSQRRAQRRVSDSERRLRAVTDHVPAQIAQVDLHGNIVFVNPEAARAIARPIEDLVNRSVKEIRGEKAFEGMLPHINEVLNGNRVSFEDHLDTPGGLRFYQCEYVPDEDADGVVRGYFGLRVDITPIKLAEQALEQIALTDALTGVANRRALDLRATITVASAKSRHSAITLLCLDIDRFKSINDRLGHQTGDEVIRQFAARLQTCVRKTDLLARLGGDEFVIVLEDTPNVEVGKKIATDIIEAMRKPMQIDDQLVPVTTSIGVGFVQAPENFDALYSVADRALYQAKEAGRNQFAVLDER